MAYPAYRPTPARAAALKKAQAASAAKRRGKGKGKLAKANRTNAKLRRGLKYAAVGGAVAGAVAGAAYAQHKSVGKLNARNRATTAKRNAQIRDYNSTRKAKMKHGNIGGTIRHGGKTYHVRPASGRPNRHNRYFATTARGTTSVRKRGH